MIELRWMIRESDEVNLDGPGPILNRVLQYRFWIAYAGANGNAMFPLEPQWSEWADVPTVKGY